MFSQSIQEIIKKRYSCRTYQKEMMSDHLKDQINQIIAEPMTAPFQTPARFKFVAKDINNPNELKGLITYGFIKGLPGFIIGAITQERPYHLEDYGYLMEKIILKATDIDLGTCWLGGSFHKSNFASKISVTSNEIIPAVVSIGPKAKKKGTVESIIRWQAKADHRHPWEQLFFKDSWNTPLSKFVSEQYLMPLEMLRLGPSASNKQPWRIVKEKDSHTYHLYLERTKGYDRSLKLVNAVDLQRVDMGIAMCHFELTANEEGLMGQWIIQDPKIQTPSNTHYIATWTEK